MRVKSLVWILVAAAACQQEPTAPHAAEPVGNAALGSVTFAQECGSCHASGDGFDLALFAFPDSTIVRRALGHVSLDEAMDIVAHVRSLPVGALSRDTRAFQPGGRVLDGDRAFAIGLFGRDWWPATLTTGGLRAIDPLDIPVAVELPVWSDEGTNMDWMPARPLEEGVLEFGGAGMAERSYRDDPTDTKLATAVRRLRNATRAPANHEAPCVMSEPDRIRYEDCFEAQRWIASLAAQHMLRTGRDRGFATVAHDAFWDVGQTVRRSIVQGRLEPDNGLQNWASWMYAGWIFEPGRHASTYTGTGLLNVGLPRHATFLALKSMVERPSGSPHPYKDLKSTARFAPESWVFDSMRFGLDHLVQRLEAGELPRPNANETMADLGAAVSRAMVLAQRKDPRVAELESLADRVLELLGLSVDA
jgi:hypothetical protein